MVASAIGMGGRWEAGPVRPKASNGPWRGGSPEPCGRRQWPCACGSHGGACGPAWTVDRCASRQSPISPRSAGRARVWSGGQAGGAGPRLEVPLQGPAYRGWPLHQSTAWRGEPPTAGVRCHTGPGEQSYPGMEGLAMRRVLPLLGLVGLLALVWAMGWHQALSWEGLAARRAALAELVAARPVAAALGYIAVYAAAVAVSPRGRPRGRPRGSRPRAGCCSASRWGRRWR